MGMSDRVDESGGAEKDGVGAGVEEARMEESADRLKDCGNASVGSVSRGDGESGKDVDESGGAEKDGVGAGVEEARMEENADIGQRIVEMPGCQFREGMGRVVKMWMGKVVMKRVEKMWMGKVVEMWIVTRK